ncbi:MAG: heme-binding sensor globin domain-containing protein [Nitrospinaceae bacterium]|nr:MAG: heme-binding sensor globin domain-containing protein [Nitrospinaceae bacterium]
MDIELQKDFLTLKAHYRFTRDDEALLLQMKPQLESAADEFLKGFYEFIWGFGKTAEFLKDETILARHRKKIRQWYLDLFGGSYDISYFMKLYKIGEIHVKLGLPTHYVNAAFNYVRVFILGRVKKQFNNEADLTDRFKAIERVLDINLDVLTSSYREGEMSRFLSLSNVEKTLLGVLKKTSSYFNYLLAIALVMVAFFAIGLFGYDVYLLFSGKEEIEKGILTILGSLLILWAAIELIHEEMKHLRGGKFALEAFIALAIAALIRKILILSLSPAQTMDVVLYGALVLCLAIAYWLIVHQINPTKR